MITELEKKVRENTSLIDKLISNYFFNNLPKKDLNTITSLISNGKFSFGQKVKLFCDMVTMSKLDKAKFKVYAKINSDLENSDMFNLNFTDTISNYHTFLLNTYLIAMDKQDAPLEDKLLTATNRLSINIAQLTKIYTEKPQLYFKKRTSNLFSR